MNDYFVSLQKKYRNMATIIKIAAKEVAAKKKAFKETVGDRNMEEGRPGRDTGIND
jgi:hypothetical protein